MHASPRKAGDKLGILSISEGHHFCSAGPPVLQSWFVNRYYSKPHGMALADTDYYSSMSFRKLLVFESHL